MSSLAPYFRVFYQQSVNSVSRLMSFRTSFILTLLADLASFLTFYLSAELLFTHIEGLGSWRREEFMFFVFWVQCIMSLHMGLIAANFWNLSDEIRTGKLDFRLVRPLGSLFDVFTAYIRPISLVMLPLYGVALIYYGRLSELSLLSWCLLLPLLLLSFILLVLLEMIMSMAMFWTTTGDGINFIRMQSQQIQKWPDFMYPQTFRILFTRFIPILAVGSYSCRYLLNCGDWRDIVFMIGAIISCSVILSYLWRKGLQRYESASS